MKRLFVILFTIFLALSTFSARAFGSLTSIYHQLQSGPVQEKVYLHLDNNCYFLGDTIWYKAYVVRADDLHYTDMSRLFYVELVSPDGIVIERQTQVASEQGFGDGCFALTSSLYSGYYELRAYTRWMLNFCVSEHPHHAYDARLFDSDEGAADFFREYDALSSRVVPVFDQPHRPGDFDYRYMKGRPKRRLPKAPKHSLHVNFFPEGGQLVAGMRCRVAFEATDEEGKAASVKGVVTAGAEQVNVTSAYLGRGDFEIDVPASGQVSAIFDYRGSTYNFDLPEAVRSGCVLRLEQEDGNVVADINQHGALPTDSLGVLVLCRGRLCAFETMAVSDGPHYRLSWPSQQLPTGVNDIIIIDETGRPLADRLFFVDNHDYDAQTVKMLGIASDLAPLQTVVLDFTAPAQARHLSISVRDRRTDEDTYDSGTLLTDLLLSSELKGFVANPDYYFADSSPVRRRHLDQLMMVQGWRRYDYATLIADEELRYEPETAFTVEGRVANAVDFVDAATIVASNQNSADPDSLDLGVPQALSSSFGSIYDRPVSLDHEVTVRSELILADEVGDIELETHDGGCFAFSYPAYLGDAALFLKAHRLNKNGKVAFLDKRLEKTSWNPYYIKRELFYPVFAKPYDYYQCHLPETRGITGEDSRFWLADESSMVRISSMDAMLDNVDVEAILRRGSRVVDLNSPTVEMDAYELYNLITDRGLSFGNFDYSRFGLSAVTALLGSYDNNTTPNIQVRLDSEIDGERRMDTDHLRDNMSDVASYTTTATYMNNIRLGRMDKVRIYTDFELRNYDAPLERNSGQWDVLVRIDLLPEGTERHEFRDRHLILPGVAMSAQFYNPDYRERPLPMGLKDYRRTLYWNPNVPLDDHGRCSIRFCNNSTAKNLHISIAGLTTDGHPVVMEK